MIDHLPIYPIIYLGQFGWNRQYQVIIIYHDLQDFLYTINSWDTFQCAVDVVSKRDQKGLKACFTRHSDGKFRWCKSTYVQQWTAMYRSSLLYAQPAHLEWQLQWTLNGDWNEKKASRLSSKTAKTLKLSCKGCRSFTAKKYCRSNAPRLLTYLLLHPLRSEQPHASLGNPLQRSMDPSFSQGARLLRL